MSRRRKHVVRLTDPDRRRLERMLRAGWHPARALTHARILLLADAGGPGRADAAVADALGCGARTVGPAVRRKRPAGPRPRKLDGDAEARLIALACSPAPGGRARWTLRLLADRRVVGAVSDETVRRTLQKTT